MFLTGPPPTKADKGRLEAEVMDLRICIDKQINAAEFRYNYGAPATKAARCKVIEEIAELIQPYNPWLLELDFGTKNETNAVIINVVTGLLKNTKPDDFMVATLRKKAQEKSEGFWLAIALLYQHDLIDQTVRDVLKEFVRNQPTPEAKKTAAMYAVGYGYGDAAIPYCERLLRQPFQTNGLIDANGYAQENKLSWDYRTACLTLDQIGTNANSLLPLLKKRQAEIKAAQGIDAKKPSLLGHFTGAIKCLEGTRLVQTEGKAPHCTWCK